MINDDNKASERIWAGVIADHTLDGYATRVWGDDPRVGTDNKPVEYIRHDLHLTLVAAENEACFDACVGEYLEDEPEIEEDKAYNRAVADCLRAIRDRTPADAQAALEARDKRIREEALRKAANVAHDAVLDHGDDQVQVRFAVLALIEKDNTDEQE